MSYEDEISAAVDEVTKGMHVTPDDFGSSKDGMGGGSESKAADTPAKEQEEASGDQGGQKEVQSAASESTPKKWTKESAKGEAPAKETGQQEEAAGKQNGESKQDPAPGVSANMLARAHAVGVPLEEARTFKSDDELADFVSLVEDGIRRQAIAEASVKSEGEAGKSAEAKKDELTLPDLDPELHDEEVVKLYGNLREVVEKQNARIKELTESQMQSVQANQAAVEREVTQWFDDQVAGLGDKMKETLGEGGYHSLRQGSPQLAKRDEIASQMQVMLAGYETTGQPVPSRERIFSDAARIVLGTEMEKSRYKEVAKTLENREGLHVNRATGKQGESELDPETEIAGMLQEQFGV
jgi:hypothetical protein